MTDFLDKIQLNVRHELITQEQVEVKIEWGLVKASG
jgi:hypothetical protein